MRILELVFQGVPGSPGLLRAAVGAGVTRVVPGAAGPMPLSRLLAHALYHEGVEPPASLRAPGAQTARLGMTLQDAGGDVYRVIRDLASGAVQLLRWDAGQKKFLPVSSRAAEVGQYLRSQVRVPGEDLFRDLFALSADGLPSRQPAEASAVTPAVGGPPAGAKGFPRPPAGGGGIHGAGMNATAAKRFPGYQGDDPGGGAGFPGYQGDAPAPAAAAGGDAFGHLPLEEKRKKLEVLRQAKAAADSIDETQFKLDGLQNRAFQLDEQLKETRRLGSEVERLDQALAGFGDLDSLPDDFEARAREYAFLAGRLEQTVGRLEGERDTLGERLALPPDPPMKHPVLLGGVGACVAFSAAALAIPGLRWVAILNPVALGAAGFVLLQWLGAREHHEGLSGRAGTLEERAAKARRQFELETVTVRKVMKDLGVDSPAAVLERYAQRNKAKVLRDEAGARLAQAAGDTGHQATEAERAKIAEEITALEQQLAGSGGYGQDPGDLVRDIEALEASIARAERGEPEPPAPEPALEAAAPGGGEVAFGALGGGSFGAGGDAEVASAPDPGPTLLARLADVLHADAESAAAGLGERPGQYLAALTNKAYVGLNFDGQRRLALVSAVGGRILPWARLSPLDQDLVYLALRLAFAEAALKVEPQPLLIESCFDELDPGRKQMVGKMLRFLAGSAQVILHSADPAWAGIADASHQVG